MSSNQNPYASPRAVAIAAEAAVEDRITFIQRTYAHLLVAIVAFVGLEFVLVNMPGAARMVQTMIGGFIAMGVIVASILFGFNLGVLFSGAMVLFASGAILYDTSNVLHHYRTDQHVAASVALFSSVIVLFLYVLRLVMAARD